MKVLNTDAVRQLYHGQYHPGSESYEIDGKEINMLAFRIAAAMSALKRALPQEMRTLPDHIINDLDRLRDMQREEGFVKGFRTAVELMEKGELHHAEG